MTDRQTDRLTELPLARARSNNVRGRGWQQLSNASENDNRLRRCCLLCRRCFSRPPSLPPPPRCLPCSHDRSLFHERCGAGKYDTCFTRVYDGVGCTMLLMKTQLYAVYRRVRVICVCRAYARKYVRCEMMKQARNKKYAGIWNANGKWMKPELRWREKATPYNSQPSRLQLAVTSTIHNRHVYNIKLIL